MSIIVVPETAVTLTGTLNFYDTKSDSGDVVSRGFCPHCGSPVFGRYSGRPDVVALTAGSLDDPGRFEPTVAIYTGSGHAWDHLDPGLRTFPGMPPAAAARGGGNDSAAADPDQGAG